ncbi:MAG: hypothetical protein IKU15_05505 [Clostridia bacterium]|nr:hypothetical protein [Treponema sp.]MBR4890725.1 hypothetical protein [Clostridia bacterium]
MNFNILPERMAQLEAQAIAEAQAEFNNEIAAETQAAFEKAYVAAVKAQKLAELRANKAKEIEKTVYEMLESAGITKEARDFIKIHESQQKALAQIGKTISVKDNESVVDSKLKKILENLKYSEAEIQELLLENQKN